MSITARVAQAKFQAMFEQLRMLVEFVDSAELRVAEPTISRVSAGGIKIRNNLFIHPQIVLDGPGRRIQITSDGYFRGLPRDTSSKIIIYPHILFIFEKVFPGVESTFNVLYRHEQPIEASVILAELDTPRFREFDEISRREFKRADAEKEHYLAEYKKKNLQKEIKRFAGKFKTFLVQNNEAQHLDLDFIYRLIRLDPKLLHQLELFARKNQTDLDFITREDLDSPRNEAVVEGIMTK